MFFSSLMDMSHVLFIKFEFDFLHLDHLVQLLYNVVAPPSSPRGVRPVASSASCTFVFLAFPLGFFIFFI